MEMQIAERSSRAHEPINGQRLDARRRAMGDRDTFALHIGDGCRSDERWRGVARGTTSTIASDAPVETRPGAPEGSAQRERGALATVPGSNPPTDPDLAARANARGATGPAFPVAIRLLRVRRPRDEVRSK
jgi:hypothetical protein